MIKYTNKDMNPVKNQIERIDTKLEEQRDQLNITRDLKYINNEIISKQADGNYTKWSDILKAVSVIGLTKQQYISYWKNKYKDTPYCDEIVKCCIDKLTDGLTDREVMIKMILKSKDFESEKLKAIKELRGDNNCIKIPSQKQLKQVVNT